MPSESSDQNGNCSYARGLWRVLVVLSVGLASVGSSRHLEAQATTPAAQAAPAAPTAPTAAQASPSSFQGSVAAGEVSPQPLDLTLDDAIQRGLRNNLGVILSSTQTSAVRGQRLSQLQTLLPSVDADFKQAVAQVDLAAQG